MKYINTNMRFLVCIVAAISLHCAEAEAQPSRLIYRERETQNTESVAFAMLSQKGQLVCALALYGVFLVDTSTWKVEQIDTIVNTAAYQYNTAGQCNADLVGLVQKGFAGSRMYHISDSPQVNKVQFPDTDIAVTSQFVAGGGVAISYSVSGIIQKYFSTNCGSEWIKPKSNEVLFPASDITGAIFAKENGSSYLSISKADLGSEFRRTPIISSSVIQQEYMSVFRLDSIAWIQKKSNVYSLCVGALDDTTSARCESSVQSEGGKQFRINSRCHLFGTQSGRMFLRDSTGVIHEYGSGTWHRVDSMIATSSSPIYGYGSAVYPIFKQDSLSFIVIRTQDSLTHELRRVLHPYISNQFVLPPIDHNIIAVTSNAVNSSSIIVTQSGHGVVTNSIFSEVEILPLRPMLCGATRVSDASPIVVAWNDVLIHPSSAGIGFVLSPLTRSETKAAARDNAPYQNTTTGLRTPYVGPNEVIFPGIGVRRFDREGRYLGKLDEGRLWDDNYDPIDRSSTCVARLQDGRLLVANREILRIRNDTAVTDSATMKELLLAPDTVRTGYVSSLMTVGDSVVLALVNGMEVRDAESLNKHPYAAGGILRSTNLGRSWTSVSPELPGPYFTGMVRALDGSISAHYTTLVIDTAIKSVNPIIRLSEDLNHTMDDRMVVRSTDNGATWHEVYRTSARSAFRLLGGDGIRLRDGRLLLITVDDILESTDDGLTWDFHTTGINEFVSIISIFTDDAGATIYYCTDKGLYKGETITSVEGDQALSRAVRHASTWTEHLRLWASSERRCVTLTNIMGEVVYCNAAYAPSPGLYIAEIEVHNTRSRVPIIVLGE